MSGGAASRRPAPLPPGHADCGGEGGGTTPLQVGEGSVGGGGVTVGGDMERDRDGQGGTVGSGYMELLYGYMEYGYGPPYGYAGYMELLCGAETDNVERGCETGKTSL